jgi:hypothetical protein
MYIAHQIRSFLGRLVLFSALVAVAIVAFAELDQSLSGTRRTVANAAADSASPTKSTVSTVSYAWNLDDANLPLLSLPDHISGAVDLAITYSLDQFQFPLFQSLYYNAQAGKYILMVMPKGEDRAEFINLAQVKRNQFEATGISGVRLEDRGAAKLLTTSDGTEYRFVHLGNGEFHCSRIKDASGMIIKLKYTDDASIASIADASGRTVSFGYEKHYVTSITQTWGPDSVKKQTWAVGDVVLRSHAPARVVPAGAEMVKRVPSNALTPNYTQAMIDSDLRLAAIFGGPGAVAAANGFEPVGLGTQYPLYRGDIIGEDGLKRRGHLSYAMHLYGSGDGTIDTDVYVPSGFTSHSSVPTPTDAAVSFYYPQLGSLTDVTLVVFHVANFQLSYEAGRVRIGHIGGPGGSISCYRHSHLEFYRGDTGLPPAAARPALRIDPNSVFATAENTPPSSPRPVTEAAACASR